MLRHLYSALEGIESNLTRLRRETLISALQPGLHPTQIANKLGQVGLSSLDIQGLYSWRNGCSTEGVEFLADLHIMPGFYWMSLEDALESYRVFAPDERWNVGWLPILENGGGDFYAVDLSITNGPQPIYAFRIEQPGHPIEFNSVVDMFATFAAAFDQGVFFVDSDGYLEMDDLVFADLAASLNPEVEWWTAEV